MARSKWVGMALTFLMLSGCWGAAAPRRGPAPQAWRSQPMQGEQSPAPLPLVPVVPEISELTLGPAFAPFTTDAELPEWTGHALLATTNNSTEPSLPVSTRGFPLCLRDDAVAVTLQWDDAGQEVYTTAAVQVDGHVGNCTAMTGNRHYLVLDSAPQAPRPAVQYRVISSSGYAPTVACAHPGHCPPLRVTLATLETALGGLKLGQLASAAPN